MKLERKRFVRKICRIDKLRIDKLSKILSRGSYIRETNMIKDIYGLVEGSQEELETIQEYLKPSKSKLLLWDDANENNIKNILVQKKLNRDEKNFLFGFGLDHIDIRYDKPKGRVNKFVKIFQK